jgi:hypothetical protein
VFTGMKLLSGFFLLLFFISQALAQEFDSINVLTKQFSAKYYGGNFLVYDCYAQHWVCTEKDAVAECLKNRERAILLKDEILPCAVVQEFQDIQKCVIANQKLVDNPHQTRFCYHPDVFKRLILFE